MASAFLFLGMRMSLCLNYLTALAGGKFKENYK